MLISSWQELLERFPDLRGRVDEPPVAAIREYLEGGGIIRIDPRAQGLKIVYPSKRMIDERIKRLRRERDFYAAELAKLRRLHRELSPIRLAFDPLFLKHALRRLFDKKYREAFDRLGFSKEHFLDPKTRKIIEAFMNNPEYRARVLDALEHSPVYKKRKFGVPITEIRKSTRASVVTSKMRAVERKMSFIDHQIMILTLLKRWT